MTDGRNEGVLAILKDLRATLSLFEALKREPEAADGGFIAMNGSLIALGDLPTGAKGLVPFEPSLLRPLVGDATTIGEIVQTWNRHHDDASFHVRVVSLEKAIDEAIRTLRTAIAVIERGA